jgi:hypothetical protein
MLSPLSRLRASLLWNFERGEALPSNFAKHLLARILCHVRLKALDKIICNMADVVDMTDELEDEEKTDKDDGLAYRMKMQRQVRAYRALDTLIGEAVRQSTQIET